MFLQKSCFEKINTGRILVRERMTITQWEEKKMELRRKKTNNNNLWRLYRLLTLMGNVRMDTEWRWTYAERAQMWWQPPRRDSLNLCLLHDSKERHNFNTDNGGFSLNICKIYSMRL